MFNQDLIRYLSTGLSLAMVVTTLATVFVYFKFKVKYPTKPALRPVKTLATVTRGNAVVASESGAEGTRRRVKFG